MFPSTLFLAIAAAAYIFNILNVGTVYKVTARAIYTHNFNYTEPSFTI